jgi:hypothetical protein
VVTDDVLLYFNQAESVKKMLEVGLGVRGGVRGGYISRKLEGAGLGLGLAFCLKKMLERAAEADGSRLRSAPPANRWPPPKPRASGFLQVLQFDHPDCLNKAEFQHLYSKLPQLLKKSVSDSGRQAAARITAREQRLVHRRLRSSSTGRSSLHAQRMAELRGVGGWRLLAHKVLHAKVGWLGGVVKHSLFEHAVLIAIVFNALLLGLNQYPTNPAVTPVTDSGQLICTGIFAVEMLMKVAGLSWAAYWQAGSNRFDLVITVISIVDGVGVVLAADDEDGGGGSGLSAFRMLRVVRALRLLSQFKNLQRMIKVGEAKGWR